MNMLATYADPAVFTASPWSVDVSGALRLGSVAGLIERAELGSAGISNVVLDDPDGTLGHSSDAILGLKQIVIDETDCPVGDQRIYSGFVADRTYRRGDSLITGVARKIDVTLVDANEILTERIMHLGFGADPAQPCDRPAETDFERIAWLLITGYVRGVFDHGLVASTGPVNMDAYNYEGQKPADIMNDCSQQSGRNHFIYYDEATATYGLFYDFNKAAVYSSSLQISNVLADVDNVTTFAPEPDAELTRDPSRVSAGVYMPFSNGTTYQERLATAVTYAFRDAAAPLSNVTTLANADIRAIRYLSENKTEEDRITCTVKLPKAKVTGIKAGHRIQAKFSHLPGMTSYVWCRITSRTVKQDELTPEFYNVDLEMSPEPTPFCSTGSMEFIADDLTNDDTPTYTPKTTAISAPVENTSMLLAILNLENIGDYLGHDLVVDTPWTMLDGYLFAGSTEYNRNLIGIAYLSYTGGAIPDATFRWSGGDPIRQGQGIVTSVAMHTSVTSEVQHVGAYRPMSLHLPSAPTEGNLLLMVSLGGTATPPPGDWVTVHEIDPERDWTKAGTIGVYMRCIGADESQDVATTPHRGPSSEWDYLSEWAIT
jgi:hypothetical protein